MRAIPHAAVLATAALLAIGVIAAPPASATDKTLKDAVDCKDFTRNGDGSWHTEGATLNYGAGGNQQINYFGAATIKKPAPTSNAPDLWGALNEKCGTTP